MKGKQPKRIGDECFVIEVGYEDNVGANSLMISGLLSGAHEERRQFIVNASNEFDIYISQLDHCFGPEKVSPG